MVKGEEGESCQNVGGSEQSCTEECYLREEYAIGADERLGNPDPHFMQIDPVIKNSKTKQQQNVTF